MTAMLNVPETAAPGEIVEIKILISHPMETGLRTDNQGKLIPRDILKELRCFYRGDEVFRAEIYRAISANPFFVFYVTADETGEIELVWIDDEGAEGRETRTLNVA